MSKLKRLVLILVLLLALVVVYLLFWPVPISPQAWTPPTAPPLTGPYQQNAALRETERLSLGTGSPLPGAGFAPEDVALDATARIYTGLDDGRIMRLQADGTGAQNFANTHGRPLGLAFDAGGNLIVADAIKGLLSVAPDGAVTVLTTAADGVPFKCTNDLDVAADGTIYFTDATSKYSLADFTADLVEHGPNGRFFAYDPKTKTTRTLLGNLSFANGVAVSPDQSFVLVVETGAYRVHRFWLKGEKAGRAEIFIDNLPGFPDGIMSNGKDEFWLALVTPRDAALDLLLPHPFLRKAIVRLPKFLQPAPKRYSFVVGLDVNGQVIDNLQNGSPDCYAEIANVVERNGTLYFGSIGESTIGRHRLPAVGGVQ
jgi:sugar lactone lactonase YvrE